MNHINQQYTHSVKNQLICCWNVGTNESGGVLISRPQLHYGKAWLAQGHNRISPILTSLTSGEFSMFSAAVITTPWLHHAGISAAITLWCWGRDIPLQGGHNKRDGVSNHRRLDCLLNRLFRCRPKKTSKPCAREFTGEFPAHKASNAENVSIWWRHHVRGTMSIPWLHYLGL